MTPLMQHAVGLARSGYWVLLDAIELAKRVEGDSRIAGLVHAPGDAALIGYLSEDRAYSCPECAGDGEVEVEGATGRTKYVTCPWCGDFDAADFTHTHLDCEEFRSLSGELRDAPRNGACWISAPGAKLLVNQYEKLVERLAASP